MKKKYLLHLLFVLAVIWQSPAIADEKSAKAPFPPFACGMFGANVANNPQADLGRIATAMFATPGEAVPVAFLEQGPWFLLDDYGSGPLMGCRPATSVWGGEDIYPRINAYNDLGMLQLQVATVVNMSNGGMTPVPLRFLYLEANPYLVSNAEQLCFASASGNTAKYYLSFRYANNRLIQLFVTQDASCPDAAGNYTFTYNSATVPNLPTKVDFVDSRGNKQSWQYGYQVANNLLQSVDVGGRNSITYSYNGSLLRQMNLNVPPPGTSDHLVMNYTAGLQWLGYKLAGAPYNWGLTLSYTNGKPVSALQNTGCPPGACSPSVFTYSTAPRVYDKKDCFVATRQEHIAAGRAVAIKGYVYAKGSGRLIGLEESSSTVSLRERGAGKFYPDPSCR